ncbi:HEAT repeat domain-containing protein [Streptomyces sp. NPDC059072]|uniref:HEAT repeat domain-containing protein n=1 Tax=unclassified Streptomyces TaxID=2593676 RepID=UPI0036747292
MTGVRQDTEEGRSVAATLLTREYPLLVAGRFASNGPAAWTAFDEEVRRLHSRSYAPLRRDRIEARLCDPDGRVRASALAAWRNPPAQLVLIRCADWAPPVRERARRVLGRLVAKDPARTLAELTPLVLRLGSREHGAWALEQLEAALSGRYSVLAAWWRPGQPSTTWSWNSLTVPQRDEILDCLRRSADPATRRFAVRLSLESGRFGLRDQALLAAGERDPLTARLWADAVLAAMAADGPDDGAIDALLGARVPMARSAGVTALRGAGRAAEAGEHLADRSELVRACARWLVRQDGGDPYARYRELLADPDRVTPYAVAGFAECAGREDGPLLRALLGHPSGAVRAAAVAGLRRLDTSHVELLRPLLDDPCPGVAREVARSLHPYAHRLPPEWLAERMAPDLATHTRRAAFRLLRAQGGLPALRAAVSLLDVPDARLRELAKSMLRAWDWEKTLRPD